MGTWRKYEPTVRRKIKDIPQLLQDNFDAIEDILDIEHETFTSASSGAHKRGVAGVVFEGTTAEISALSNPPTGAMAFDESLGVSIRYDGSVWKRITQDKYSRLRAYYSLPASSATVSASETPSTLVYDTETYDTLGEYNNSTGVFTASGDGYYLVVATVSLYASGSMTTSAAASATSNISTSWATSGSSINYENIDEYPTPNDSDLNTSQTSNAKDLFGFTAFNVPAGSTGIVVKSKYRARRRGCTCNNTCYQQSCTCNTTCYGHSCSCNNTCYGYTTCSCNNTCYGYEKSCGTCYGACYGYTACSCNNTCYQQSCSCNAAGYGTSCGCNVSCYNEDATRPAPILKVSDNIYQGATIVCTPNFEDYVHLWEKNPATGADWLASAANAIQGFGYTIAEGTVGCSADVSQAFLETAFWPKRPVVNLYLYKNTGVVHQTSKSIMEAGTNSYQTVSLVSLVQLTAGNTLTIKMNKTMENDTIYGSPSYTYLCIHRLSGVGI